MYIILQHGPTTSTWLIGLREQSWKSSRLRFSTEDLAGFLVHQTSFLCCFCPFLIEWSIYSSSTLSFMFHIQFPPVDPFIIVPAKGLFSGIFYVATVVHTNEIQSVKCLVHQKVLLHIIIVNKCICYNWFDSMSDCIYVCLFCCFWPFKISFCINFGLHFGAYWWSNTQTEFPCSHI